jgi:hypothetical protein
MEIKNGSRWSGSNGKVYHVLHVVELEGHTWVHYILETKEQDINKEFSCYQESFLLRFTPLPE